MDAPRVRIAVGQISSESDYFVTLPCELDLFRATGFLYERNDLVKLAGTGGEIAGVLAMLQEMGDVDVVPLLAARCNSSGPLSETCYGYLREHLLTALREARPVEGVILSHHGSMAAVNEDDTEGDIAAAVRDIVGPAVPIVMTLDCHANVTRRMVEATNAILGYEQYPHYDVYTTGWRAAALLRKAIRGEVKPVMAHAKLPMLVTGFNGSTVGDGPFARLMRQAKTLEEEPDILSASMFCVGSYLDMPDMGCSSVVISDGSTERAVKEVRKLASAFWENRRAFDVDTVSVADAVERGRAITGGPVLLLDTADTTGGGAAGDSIDLVKGLMAVGVDEPCLAMVVDPDAVQTCLRAGVGRDVSVELGHKVDPIWGTPTTITGRVLRATDGRFQYTGGILGGTWASMGPSVVVGVGVIQILIMTYPTYDWADEQYHSVGMNPARAKFVGVKNMMNFRYGYRDVMKGFFVLNLPGPTPPDMRSLPFKRATRPLFPLDEDFTDLKIQISTSRY